jgi:MoaA/NifB/PqqE/SkfB family radical SAM enzyme
MKIEMIDKSLMMIFLLEECNFDCPHCVRGDEPMDIGYKLSFRQLQLCLSDCRRLESITWIHFSGGEPTIWREGDRDLVDLLLEISNHGFTPGFTTNGSSFLDYDRCQDFFRRYVDRSISPLRLYFSIDTFHGNFDIEKGRALSLDNLTKYKQGLPRNEADLLDTRVVTVISKDYESLLPDEMVDHYQSLGVSFGFIPLGFRGRARSLGHLCPDLESDNPEDLGAYQRFITEDERKTRDKIGSLEEANNLVLIGDTYYARVHGNQTFRESWQKIAQLDNLPDTIVRAYTEEVSV